MNKKEQRWLELKFWIWCSNFTQEVGDIQLLFQFIDTYRNLTNYRSLLIQRLAYDSIMQQQYKPDKAEIVLLMHEMKYSVRDILKYAKINCNRFYEILKTNEQDPRAYLPRYTPEDHVQMQKFLDALELFKKLGV